jgi:hypothetical protein
MSETREQFLSRVLGCTVEQLDITVGDFQEAEQRYTDVGKYLADEGADVYVQGSFMLGTVVRPVRPRERIRPRPRVPTRSKQREHKSSAA